ncbi:MAG: alpha/beta hydrolase [Dactylosporangium sp.]|nr:alpha/beta hydrolase [Dactylosporangium sp.]
MLGPPYTSRVIDLGCDREGPVRATLVRRLAGTTTPADAAVLYLHGFVDYFFQRHLGDFYCGQGIDFYALDLRKYGRSLMRHQTPCHCDDLGEYYPEIDEAIRLLRQADGHTRVLLNGHSMGGLLSVLWADDRRQANLVDAIVLNSPFLDLDGPWIARRLVAGLAAGIGRVAPTARVAAGLNAVYGRSISREHDGDWAYDLGWKPLAGFPVRAGWIRAIRAGQRRVRSGLPIEIPILVATSTSSRLSSRWSDAARSADTVLDVATMARWAPSLGRQVTLARVEGGMHDLTLSEASARRQFFDLLTKWISVHFA